MVTPWGELPAPFYPSSENSDCRCTSWVFILGEAGPDLDRSFTARKYASFGIGNPCKSVANEVLQSFRAKFRRDSVSIREKRRTEEELTENDIIVLHHWMTQGREDTLTLRNASYDKQSAE